MRQALGNPGFTVDDDSLLVAQTFRLAEKRGVGYQTVIKTLLHEALKRESKIA